MRPLYQVLRQASSVQFASRQAHLRSRAARNAFGLATARRACQYSLPSWSSRLDKSVRWQINCSGTERPLEQSKLVAWAGRWLSSKLARMAVRKIFMAVPAKQGFGCAMNDRLNWKAHRPQKRDEFATCLPKVSPVVASSAANDLRC